MSSSTLERIMDYLSHLQERDIFTRERLLSIRLFFFQSIGCSIVLYQLLKLLYLLLKFLFWFILQLFWLPLRTIELFLPNTTNYYILVPLIGFCSFVSFFLSKFFEQTPSKRRALVLKCTVLLIFQVLFILLPVAMSIHERRELTTGDSTKDMELNRLNDYLENSQGNNEKIESFDLEMNKLEESTLRKSDNWLDRIPTILHIPKRFTSSKEHVSPYSVSSIDTAFTDLNCYDYTKSIYQDKQKHHDFLNTYRYRSPFPIYLSIIQLNGPTCQLHSRDSSCAIRSQPTSRLYRFVRFWMIICIPLIISIVIYKHLKSRPHFHAPSQPVQSTVQANVPSREPLDQTIENKLRLWLTEEEKNQGYHNISQSCRLALNRTFCKQYPIFLDRLFNSSYYLKTRCLNQLIRSLNEGFSFRKERLKIESLEFTHVKLRNVSQTSTETIVIHAILDVDQLLLNVSQDQQQFTIQIPRLTGELEIGLIEEKIEVKFQRIQMNSAEIRDLKNVLSVEEKEAIVKLLKDVIHQTTVHCHFHLSEDQELATQRKLPPVVLRPPTPVEQLETPIITPIANNPPTTSPAKAPVKKLLVRIVKAVQLHDVEQPYCILELNYPKQTHQTSLAKNGLNPFWDERFLFDCNEKSNQIRLQIIDRHKANKKRASFENVYADVSIPFSYITSTIYKQDVRITPEYPDSIIRIEFSTFIEEEEDEVVSASKFIRTANNGYDIESIPNWSNIIRNHPQSPSDEVLALAYNTDGSPKGYILENNHGTIDELSTASPIHSLDEDSHLHKSRKSRSFMNSFRLFSRGKKRKHHGNGLNHSIPHSFSAEPVLPSSTTDPPVLPRHPSLSRSVRHFFKGKASNTDNFILDHPDLFSNSTGKKATFFRRFRSKQKSSMHFSSNSLTSEDCTRSESVRNTPIRANVGRPVTMT